VVATPIGNLGDLSPRAVEVLKQVDVVLAEDTRRTRGLLSHFGIASKRLERLDAHVEAKGISGWVDRVAGGGSLALVSDAGMPMVSDPGAELVRAVGLAGLEVVVVPGPSAVTTALAASGLCDGPFRFEGFLPRTGHERRRALAAMVRCSDAVVFFESPERLAATLGELAERGPDREAIVARELTKRYEQIVRGSVAELAVASPDWRGEITVVLGAQAQHEGDGLSEEQLDSRIAALLAEGMRPRDVAKALALETSLSASEVYRRVTERQDDALEPD
jgi:16S rRNA (cytidine1402-2'-O)-methyltransferase